MKRLAFSALRTDTLTGILDLMYILRDFEEQAILTVGRETIKACSHGSAVTCGDPDSLSGQSDGIIHQRGAMGDLDCTYLAAPHHPANETASPLCAGLNTSNFSLVKS